MTSCWAYIDTQAAALSTCCKVPTKKNHDLSLPSFEEEKKNSLPLAMMSIVGALTLVGIYFWDVLPSL